MRKPKPKRVSGSVLPVALLLVGTVVKPHNLGSYCHISMRPGLGRSDTEPVVVTRRVGRNQGTVPGNPVRLVPPGL